MSLSKCILASTHAICAVIRGVVPGLPSEGVHLTLVEEGGATLTIPNFYRIATEHTAYREC